MAKYKDITNTRFGRLIAMHPVGRDKFKIMKWNCQCDCGHKVDIRLCSLTAGDTKSCGCLNEEVRISSMIGNKKAETHALSNHKLYSTWSEMKQRCSNPKRPKYKHYGGRGIAVCGEWTKSFVTFLSDMGERPVGHTLSRIDNDGNYCKENCEWQTHSEQNRNRRKYKRNNTGLFNEVGR